MKLITPIDSDDEQYINTEIRPTDDPDELHIYNLDGYAGVHGVQLNDYLLSWEQLDKLKEAIAYAEKLWRG